MARYVEIPDLDATMRKKEATNVALSEASGVSLSVVEKARRGGSIRHYLADALRQALEEKEFSYGKRGPK